MGGYNNFYNGADYGMEAKGTNYGEFLGMEYRTPVSNIGLAIDARTANQLQKTSEWLNTGTKAVEIQMTMPDVAESIPNQHLEEINRLRKLTGTDLTLHGPLVEPTGITKNGWDESQRLQSERQMWTALQRSKILSPDGNIVVTFHSSNGLPEPEVRVMEENPETHNMEEVTKNLWVVDERTGNFGQVEPKKHYFPGQEGDPFKEIENKNEENWTKSLQQLNYHAYQGTELIDRAFKAITEKGEKNLENKELLKFYKNYGEEETQKDIEKMGEYGKTVKEKIDELTHADLYLRDAYSELKNIYDVAYDAAKRNADHDEKSKQDLKKLDAFKDRIGPRIKELQDPANIKELGEEISNGINILRTITPPKSLRPLKEFAIDKASDTFSSLAWKSYKELGGAEGAPIISIENPPAGSGLSRAEELRDLVKETHNKFVERAKEEGMSESEARKTAEKLIGVTWDVGHINMIRKYGYGEKELGKQTEQIAKHVKNIHLSDNFGMEHTELPMGMGNVPTKVHMDILDKYAKQVKKIVEVGNWHQHFGARSPFSETLAAFGSPIYSMQLAPVWNQAYGRQMGGYFAGYGMNPDIHHSIYGAGFSGLPIELGGQIAGKNRLSGSPTD